MADADRIAAALRYQQELDTAQRPATMNPNIAAQGEVSRNRIAAALANQPPSWSGESLPMKGRATFLPFRDTIPGSVMNKRELALPGMVAGAVNAFTAPARSMQSLSFVDEDGNVTSNFNAPEEAVNVAMNMMGGGIGTSRVAPIPNGSLGMNVYHGTPHRFPPTAKNPLGEFDPMKIGTGEGAQAYGHGLYLAESPKVAQDYAVTLAAKNGEVGGRIGNTAIADAYKAIESQANRLPPAQAAPMYNKMDLLERLGYNELPDDVLKYAKESYGAASPEVKWLETSVLNKYKGPGNLYKVDLPDEQIAKMLDWDKKLKDQPDILKAVLDSPKYKNRRGFDPYPEMTGKDLYEMGHDQVKSLGIPGIRYLDQGSRAGGAGTSNFVVFDPKHMNIIGRE